MRSGLRLWRRWLPVPAIARRSAAVLCALAFVAGPTSAQRTVYRDPAGNPKFHIQSEGARSVLRDNAGNMHGYWQKEGNALVHRDNAGNLLDRQRME
jgi:hypothetical protein